MQKKGEFHGQNPQMSASDSIGPIQPQDKLQQEERKDLSPNRRAGAEATQDVQMKSTVVAPVKRQPRKRTPATGDRPKRERKPREPKEKVMRSRTPINNITRKVVHA